MSWDRYRPATPPALRWARGVLARLLNSVTMAPAALTSGQGSHFYVRTCPNASGRKAFRLKRPPSFRAWAALRAQTQALARSTMAATMVLPILDMD